MPPKLTTPLRKGLASAIPSRPFAIEFWDGTELPANAGPNGDGAHNGSANGGAPVRFVVRSPDALAHLLRAPGQLGLGRAYATGGLDVDDLDHVMELLDWWSPPALDTRTRLRLGAAAALACGPRARPRLPAAELRPRGVRHSRERDARAVRHHYDVSNDFFRLFLDESLTYSCAFFSRGAETLEEAQHAKLELVCQKLGLSADDTVLDVGCGWGSFALHAATEHGAKVVAITLSPAQAQLARERVAHAGLEDRVDVRLADYREIEGERFDAIASIGMVEHVGSERIDLYARRLAELLRPGGALLNHGIARLRHSDAPAGAFSERYVFPDGEPLQLSRVLLALERAGFQTRHVEDFGADYAQTLKHWAQRLDDRLEEARRLVGPERTRVWRLYLRAARNGFETGFTDIYQVRASLAQ